MVQYAEVKKGETKTIIRDSKCDLKTQQQKREKVLHHKSRKEPSLTDAHARLTSH